MLAAVLTAAPSTITLHPNAQTAVTIAGAQGALAATSASGIVTVSVDAQERDTLDVRAGATAGSDTVHVTDASGDALDVPVRVAMDAGTFPSQVRLAITGSPVDWKWLWAQIAAAIARASQVQPGAVLAVASPSPLPDAPPPDASIALDAPVTISGGSQFYEASGITRVTVANEPVQPVAPPLLLYDDDPEKVDANGVIFRANVTSAQAVRLYYYHEDVGDPRRLVVLLRAARATRVQAIDSSAGPNVDVLSVGHAVSLDALAMTARNQGVIYPLAAGRFTVLHDVLMTTKQGVAGSIGLQVLGGGPAQIEVLSLAPDAPLASALDGPLLPRDGHHRDGTFAIENFGAIALEYTAGGPDARYEYGTRAAAPANVDAASDGTDFGDYGVIHTLLFSLSNPAPQPKTVFLYERPLGGVVRSSFLVDGVLRQVGCVRDPQERYQIAAFQLAPGGRYQLSVQTMTDGGSSYPLEVGLTATPPLPSAPPISARDGCFPKPTP